MKTIQVNILRASLAAIVLGSAGTFNTLSAATAGNLGLSGSVAVILELSIQTLAGASSLTPSSNTSGQMIAVVFETCNDDDGYTTSMVSTNGDSAGANTGILVGANAGETLPYTISYNESPVTMTDGAAVVTDNPNKTISSGVGKIVRISYDGSSSNLAADSYSDTLTFSIAAK